MKTITYFPRRPESNNMKTVRVVWLLLLGLSVVSTAIATSPEANEQMSKVKLSSAINSNLICLYGGYCRSTADCVPGSQCNIQNQFYSQCVQDLSQYLAPSTGCVADYSSGCNIAGAICCNPGYVCVGNSAYAQCAPLQPPLCSLPSGFSPLPIQSKSPSKSPLSVNLTSVSPLKPPSGCPTSVSPRKPPSAFPSVSPISQPPNITPTITSGSPLVKPTVFPSPFYNVSNPFQRTANYYVNPTYQAELQSSIVTASGKTKTTLQSMLQVSSAYWIDVKAKINGLNTTSAEGILIDAAKKSTKQLVTLIVYDLPNRDCHAKASNGEICCTYNIDKTCNYDVGGDCAAGMVEYQSSYIDPLYAVLSRYDQAVEIVLIIEPDSLPNLATNAGDQHCGNSATTAAYRTGIAYAVNKFKSLRVSIYLDGAHGGWLGWTDNIQKFTALVVEILGSNSIALRGFATNVANYQPIGIMCPFQSSDNVRNDYCLSGQHQSDPCCADPCNLEASYNPANNELNYVNEVYHSFKLAMPSFNPHFVIDSGRNGVGNMRSACSNWCNIRGAGIGVPPTFRTAAPNLVDAYFWLKTPGESDGCTQILPDGTNCPRFDSFCSSVDSIGSINGEPRAPQAGQWFDYQIQQLASNAVMLNYSVVVPTPQTPSNFPTSVTPSITSPIPIAFQSSSPTIFTTSISSFSSNRICLYGGYCTSTSDCVPGSKCNVQSQFYSQCVPDLSQYLAASTGCVADYSSGCNIAGSICCNPGYVCVGNSANAQCSPAQPPICTLPSGYIVGPLLTQSPSSSVSPIYRPSITPLSPTVTTTVAPSSPTYQVTSQTPSNFPTSVTPSITSPIPIAFQSSSPTIFTTSISSFSTNRICLYGGYCTSTSDCVPGSKCNVQSQFYSQCVPDLSQYLAASTGCVADYSSGCTIKGSICCNPGYVCAGNSANAQCSPAQPPICTLPSGYIVGPLLTQSPSSSVSPIYRPSITPLSPTVTTTVAPSSPTYQVTSSPTKSPTILATVFPTTTQAPNIKASSVLSTKGNQIVDSNGNPVRLTGINWFGYETHDAIVHGLWTRNYKSMLDQVKGLRFNVLRIPFCNQNLIAGTSPSSPDYNKNPDLVGLSTLETLDKIVAYCGVIGLRIFLDRHSAKADNYLSEPLWYIQGDAYYTEDRFIKDWVMLAKRYRHTAVIGADLWNEPKSVNGAASTWGTGDVSTDWNLAAQRAGNAILAANPDWLIIVEGTAQNTWWGGNLMGVQLNPVVLDVPSKVVYSIHEYSQEVYNQPWFSDPSFPTNLRPRWNSFWGYLFRTQTAPLLIGEFGTNFAYSADAVWLPILLNYMAGELVTDGQSDLLAGQQGMSWTFWCLNPNSGDTGGILLNDWVTVDERKMSFLTPMLAQPLP